MGKRKFHLSVGRKNEERKRWGFHPVRISLNAVSVLNVSQYIIYAAIMFLMVLGLLVLTAVLANGTSCDPACNLGIVESIPQNLTYPSDSPTHLSTYDAWSRLLMAAKETVDIASFYWVLRGEDNARDPTDWEGENIFKALVNISTRKVKTRIVQNPPDSEFPDLDSLALAKAGAALVQNLNVTALIGSGVLHTKLLVVDQRHFYVGSANMDWRSLTQVKEMGLLGMNCECLARDAQKLFDVYWYLSSPGARIPDPWPSQFTADTSLSHPATISINGTSAVAFWASSPTPFCATGRTHDLDALLHVINSAQKFVYVAVMDYFPALIYQDPHIYWPQIDDALRSAAYSRGVNVRVMGSYWNHTLPDMLKFLRSLADMSGTGSFQGTIETVSVPYLSIFLSV